MKNTRIRARSMIFLALLWMLSSASCFAQEVEGRIDAYLNALVKMGQFSGSVLVARDGKVLFSRGYGMANLEHDVPNTPRTRFRLGSVTKQFTATAILLLQEQGKLSVQDPVRKLHKPPGLGTSPTVGRGWGPAHEVKHGHTDDCGRNLFPGGKTTARFRAAEARNDDPQ